MNKADQQNLRLLVCKVLLESLPDNSQGAHQQSLQLLFSKHLSSLNPQSRALAMNICFGVFRHYFLLTVLLKKYLQKPLKNKDQDVFCVLLASAYELFFLNTPEHAVISESVNVCERLHKTWAKALVNAVLRNIQRSQLTPESFTEALIAKNLYSEEIAFGHPQWLINQLKTDWQERTPDILEQNNHRAPMVLRVNKQFCSQQDYLDSLSDKGVIAHPSPDTENCIYLQDAMDVHELPGFNEGWVSVQDEAAQQAGFLMDLHLGQNVLDACAAPGGKSAHMLELEPDIHLTCLDISASRLEKVTQNFARMKQTARCIQANAGETEQWWDGTSFDRILLDAPCTASGIIRRNPDIKLQRKPEDIPRMAKQQLSLLVSLWPCLKKGGTLLYATCSVFKEENEQLIESFLKNEKCAALDEFTLPLGFKRAHGQQLFPLEDRHDGFFYARLKKL